MLLSKLYSIVWTVYEMTLNIILHTPANVCSCSCAYGNLFCTERDCDRDDDDDDDDEEEEEDNDRDGTDSDRDSTDGDRDGSGDDEDRPCDACREQPVRKVCGRSNGVTYPNKCFAVMCAGISPVDLIDEPCQHIVSLAVNRSTAFSAQLSPDICAKVYPDNGYCSAGIEQL